MNQAKHCNCLWSSSPYNGPGLDPIVNALGFVRFRKELIEAVPDLFNLVELDKSDVPAGSWRRLDSRINSALRDKKFELHEHEPVLHHHVYRSVCSCMTEHEVFNVDLEGRFKP